MGVPPVRTDTTGTPTRNQGWAFWCARRSLERAAPSAQRNVERKPILHSAGNIERWFNLVKEIAPLDKPCTIGQLAAQADVPTSTVRYYERRGLLRCEGRTRANYRQYGEATLERLRFIRAAQAAGFTLVDIRSLHRHRQER